MSRRRLTWEQPSRKASAPPATPGYEEPSVHPAAYPDPEADAYENGDTSSWAEDPHPGPYPNSAPPALPGTEEPQGHPATDPAHYFPGGASRQASRQLRAALEQKAAKCVRLASRMLGKTASAEMVEDMAIDMMNFNERQLQAMQRRFAMLDGGRQDIIAFENETLTPPRTAEEDDTEMLLKAMQEEEEGDDEAKLASMLAEEKSRLASKKAAKKAGQNDPRATYSGKKAEDEDEPEADEEASKKAADEDKPEEKAEDKKAEADEDKAETEASKKAAHFQRLAAHWARVKKAEDEAKAEEEKGEDKESAKKAGEVPEAFKDNQFKAKDDKKDEKAEDKKAAAKAEFLRLASEFLSADMRDSLAAVVQADVPVEKSADDVLVDDLLMEDSVEDPMIDGLGMTEESDIDMDDLSVLYGMHTASEDTKVEEKAEEKAEEDKAEVKKAAVRPQARKASAGVKSLGTVAKVASTGDSLSGLWASAPDVSSIFGTK